MRTEKEELLSNLTSHLQTAIELEHSTLPTYLYAYWSIALHPEAASAPASVKNAATAIHDVLMEEMLHLAMACNVLCALGSKPVINGDAFVPAFPAALPGHSATENAFIVNLEKCGLSSIVTFMQIELPAASDAPPEGDNYATIGQFYKAVVDMLSSPLLEDSDFQHGEQMTHYVGRPTQADDNDPVETDKKAVFYAVRSRRDAINAINEITAEGEGFCGTDFEAHSTSKLAHYYQFEQTYRAMGGLCREQFRHFRRKDFLEQVDQSKYADFQRSVLDLATNPDEQSFTQAGRAANAAFNSCYSEMLDHIHATFHSSAPQVNAFSQMFQLQGLAQKVVAETLPDGTVCGPTFRYLPEAERVKYGA